MKCSAVLFLMAVGVLFAASAFATGNEGSGGGNAIVCFYDPNVPRTIRANGGKLLDKYISAIKSVETLDLFDAERPRGKAKVIPDVIPIGPNETSDQYLERIAARFDKAVPAIAKRVRDAVTAFDDRNISWQPHGIKEIADSGSVSQLDHDYCVLATMGAQYSVGTARFLKIDRRLFDHPTHSELSKAIFYLHEGSYLYARTADQQTDSQNTSLFISMLITQNDGMMAAHAAQEALSLGFLRKEEAYSYVGGGRYTDDLDLHANRFTYASKVVYEAEGKLREVLRELVEKPEFRQSQAYQAGVQKLFDSIQFRRQLMDSDTHQARTESLTCDDLEACFADVEGLYAGDFDGKESSCEWWRQDSAVNVYFPRRCLVRPLTDRQKSALKDYIDSGSGFFAYRGGVVRNILLDLYRTSLASAIDTLPQELIPAAQKTILGRIDQYGSMAAQVGSLRDYFRSHDDKDYITAVDGAVIYRANWYDPSIQMSLLDVLPDYLVPGSSY